MKLQSAQNNQNNLEKEESWRKMFQFHNKTVVIEQLLLWRKDRHKDHGNRTNSPEINPFISG